ncbi:MAG TPA: hypothetical protein VF637_16505 [Sphingomicrobium sp.]|jgi:hypothetical protein
MTSTKFTLKGPIGSLKKTKAERLPETVAEFVQLSLDKPPVFVAPPKAARSGKPRGNGIWGTMTPDERSVYARSLAAKRTPEGIARSGRKADTPHGWTQEAAAAARAQARLDASRLVAKMRKEGVIAKDDKETAEATVKGLAFVRFSGQRRAKEKMARRLLRVYGPENTSPVQPIDIV